MGANRREIIFDTPGIYGAWTAIAEAGRNARGRRLIRARCPHGEFVVYADNLLGGRSRGCVTCGGTTHGLSLTPEYQVCYLVIRRCTDPDCNDYEHYGGKKGNPIMVQDDWYTPENLGIGAARMARYVREQVGLRPSPQHQIDRVNNEGNYTEGNLRWVLPPQNSRNRSDNRKITHNGKMLCLCEWSEKTGIGSSTIARRLNVGDPPWLALAPVQDYRALKRDWRQSQKEAA